MRDFSITEQDIAISRARWEPEFRAFAERSSRLLTAARRLPIYDQAVLLSRDWLAEKAMNRDHLPPKRALLLVGDEHLEAAASALLTPAGIEYTHIFPEAWVHWLRGEFRGNPGWWESAHWAINNSQRLLHFAQFEFSDPGLRPNDTFLLSTAWQSRGTDSICRLVEGKLLVDAPFAEWVESV